jgi:hypothetical protein
MNPVTFLSDPESIEKVKINAIKLQTEAEETKVKRTIVSTFIDSRSTFK